MDPFGNQKSSGVAALSRRHIPDFDHPGSSACFHSGRVLDTQMGALHLWPPGGAVPKSGCLLSLGSQRSLCAHTLPRDYWNTQGTQF